MYEEIADLKRSKTKLGILKKLLSEPKTPMEIAKDLKLYQSSVSRSLKQLEEQKLAECLTPNQYNYRHYRITSKGRKIIDKLI